MEVRKISLVSHTHTRTHTHRDIHTHTHTHTHKLVEYLGMIYTIILSENDQEGM